jgi:hypothetical protein
MATTTTNFGWDIPQSTDLVKDGATAIAALGQDIDTALVDLKGGTTGQVLAKATNTDLDFSWVAQDDSNAIQNAIVDAKGDLIAATAADTPARLAVGTDGQVLTADSTTATGLKWAAASSGALTLVGTTTLSSSASFNLSNVFSSSYANYEIHITGLTGSTSSFITYGLRTGSTNAASNYDFFYYQISTAGGVANGGGTGSLTGGNIDYDTSAGHMILKVMNPFVASPTGLIAQYTAHNAQGIRSTRHTNSTSYESMWFTVNSGTVSGKVSVYGYSN